MLTIHFNRYSILFRKEEVFTKNKNQEQWGNLFRLDHGESSIYSLEHVKKW